MSKLLFEKIFVWLFIYFVFVVLGIKPRASQIHGISKIKRH